MGPRDAGVLGAWRRRGVPALLVLSLATLAAIAACSAASRGAGSPGASGRANDGRRTSPAARWVPADGGKSHTAPRDQLDALTMEAFALLDKSAADSCASCARDSRRRALELFAERFPAGAIVSGDSARAFVLVAGGENELRLTPDVVAAGRLTFRFHTTADHLVGIAATDLTDETLAELARSMPSGTPFRGAIEIIPFAYGDGPTFLHRAATNGVQVQCRILQIDME